MKKCIFILAVLLFSVLTANAECIKCGTIEKIIATQDSLTILLDGKEFTVLNPSKLIPGDFAKVYSNNQGDYYLVRASVPTGTVLKIELLKDKTLVRFTNGQSFYIDGFHPVQPGKELILIPDCDQKYKIKGKT